MTVEPEDADGVNTQPAAVPRFVKSAGMIPVTDSLNVKPKVNDIAEAGDEGEVDTVAVGGSTSIFMVDEFVATAGPVCDVTADVTASCATERITDPDVTFEPDKPTTYDAPLPEKDVIDHPVLVPDKEISD